MGQHNNPFNSDFKYGFPSRRFGAKDTCPVYQGFLIIDYSYYCSSLSEITRVTEGLVGCSIFMEYSIIIFYVEHYIITLSI